MAQLGSYSVMREEARVIHAVGGAGSSGASPAPAPSAVGAAGVDVVMGEGAVREDQGAGEVGNGAEPMHIEENGPAGGGVAGGTGTSSSARHAAATEVAAAAAGSAKQAAPTAGGGKLAAAAATEVEAAAGGSGPSVGARLVGVSNGEGEGVAGAALPPPAPLLSANDAARLASLHRGLFFLVSGLCVLCVLCVLCANVSCFSEESVHHTCQAISLLILADGHNLD